MCFNSQAMSLGIQQKPKLREISLVPNNFILFLGIAVNAKHTRTHIAFIFGQHFDLFFELKSDEWR